MAKKEHFSGLGLDFVARMVDMPPNGDLTSAVCPSCKHTVGGNAVLDIVQYGFEQTKFSTFFLCACGQHVGCTYIMLDDQSEILSNSGNQPDYYLKEGIYE